jgi:hypothetical protein
VIFLKKTLIFIFLFLLTSFVSSAYTDYSVTDIYLPNVVREDEDLNITILFSSNKSAGNINFDLNIYTPQADLIYNNQLHHNLTNPSFNIILNSGDLSNSLNYSTQPYLLRVYIIEGDDNPSNDLYSKYFTVSKSKERIPVSDLPLFSGIFIALIALFIVSYSSKKEKNDLK